MSYTHGYVVAIQGQRDAMRWTPDYLEAREMAEDAKHTEGLRAYVRKATPKEALDTALAGR